MCQFARAAHAEENHLDTPMTLESGTGVCEISTLVDSGVYKIGQQFCLKRVLASGARFEDHGCTQSA